MRPMIQWCQQCWEDGTHVLADSIIKGVPLCKGCAFTVDDAPEVKCSCGKPDWHEGLCAWRVHRLADGEREKIMGEVLDAARTVSEDWGLTGETDPIFQATVILLTGIRVSLNTHVIHALTGYPEIVVIRCNRNLRRNGVWFYGQTHAEWLSEDCEYRSMSLMLDAMVAIGDVERDNSGPEITWKRTPRELGSI